MGQTKVKTGQQLTLDRHVEMCHKSLQPNVSKCQDEDSLKIHEESAHGGKKPYKCSLCDFDFNSIFEVMSHVKEIHFDVSPIFDQDNQNNNTLNSESEISEVPATPLENRTLSEESRSDHVNPKNSDPKMSEIPASSSKKRTLSEESRSEYVRWVMDNFGSEDENTEFIEEPKSDHVNPKKRQKQDNCLHHKDEEKKHVKCSICVISFSKNSSLNQHNESVHEGRFECSDCNNVFGIKSALIQHIESVHKLKNQNETVFKCNTCNEEFLRQSSYRQHIESVHEVKKSFNCYACVSEFALQSSLTQHIENVHEMKKLFKCKD